MKSIIGAVIAAGMSLTHAIAVQAATSKPMGKYVFTLTETCEAKFGATTSNYLTDADLNTAPDPDTLNTVSDSAVKAVSSIGNGHIGIGVGSITFKPASKFDLKFTNISGGALRILLDGVPGGVNVTSQQVTITDGTFAVSAAGLKLTLPNNTIWNFTAAYGELDADKVPISVHLARKMSSGETGNCVQAMTVTR